MRHVLLFPLLIFLTNTYGQGTQSTFFLKDSGQKADSEDEADFIRIIEPTPDKSGNFEFREYYKNDSLKRQGYSSKSLSLNIEGLVNGYDKTGVKISEQTFLKNRPVGQLKVFYLNGQLKKVFEYESENPEDKLLEYIEPPSKLIAFYDSLGVQTLSDGNGFAEEKENNVFHKGKYKNGVKDGVWVGHSLVDDFRYQEIYTDGNFISGISGKKVKYSQMEEMPENDFNQYVSRNFRYPKHAKELGISGTVVLSFDVDEKGNIEDIKVLKDPGQGTAEEVIRLLQSFPKWKPVKSRGIPVKATYTLPVTISGPR